MAKRNEANLEFANIANRSLSMHIGSTKQLEDQAELDLKLRLVC
jgi:hypothetical protein